LAAETAEVLRESPFTKGPAPATALAQVLGLAEQVDPQLRSRTAFNEFVTLVSELKKAKPYRGGSRK
jgi:hypothetical protein